MSPTGTGFSGRFGRFLGWNAAQQGWFVALSLVSTPILYRALGEDAYGLLGLVNVVVAQVAILELGFGQATIRWLARARSAEDPDGQLRVVRTSSAVFLAVAFVGGVAVFAGRDWLATGWFQIPEAFQPTARAAFGVAAALFVTSLLGNLATALWQGLHRFDRMNVIGGIGVTLQVAGSVAIALSGASVVWVVAWTVVLGTGLLAVHLHLLRRELPDGSLFGAPDRTVAREMAGYGSLLMVAGLFSQVHLTTGTVVLGTFVAIGALPLFTIPFSIYQRVHRLAAAVSSALFPLVVEMDEKGDEASIDRLFLSGTRALVLAMATVGVPGLLLTGPFLTAWMGADFAETGAPVLRRLLFAALLVVCTVPSVEIARGRGRSGRIAVYVGVLATANLIGLVLLAPTGGVIGAATAFAAAQVVGSLLIVTWTGGRATVGLLNPRVLVFGGVAVAIWRFTAPRIEDHEVLLGLGGAAAGALVLGGLARWVLDPRERDVLARIVGRRR